MSVAESRRPPVLSGIASLSEQFDGFILDIWGVLHNGVGLFPDAVSCLRQMQLAGKRVTLLTNAPRRAELIATQLTQMGLDRSLYTEIVSSGELVWRALQDHADPWRQALRGPVYQIGPHHVADILADQGFGMTEHIDQAGFILATGPTAYHAATLAEYTELLEVARTHQLPMICANPDRWVMHGENRMMCAGAIGEYYERQQGIVHYFGKPLPAAFDACLSHMPECQRDRIMVVGDSLVTDIGGAHASGLASVLVASGLHQDVFVDDGGRQICYEVLDEILATASVQPDRVMLRLCW